MVSLGITRSFNNLQKSYVVAQLGTKNPFRSRLNVFFIKVNPRDVLSRFVPACLKPMRDKVIDVTVRVIDIFLACPAVSEKKIYFARR
jgi:hypothetical protein